MGKEEHAPVISIAFREIMALKMPCEITESETEFLCEDCPYDIKPRVDCGLAVLQERASMIKLEMDA